MCFSSPKAAAPPPVPKVLAPPQERDANMAGMNERMRRARMAAIGNTDATGGLGDPSPAPTVKTKLGV